MRKLSFLALFFIVAACSTDSSEEGSGLQTNVSNKIVPSIIGASGSSNLSSAISQLGISSESQKLLLSSVNEIVRLKQAGASYEEVHAYRVDFKNKVMASTISSKEKEVLLPSLSIVQYDIYATEAGGRKDRDWELSVGNFIVRSNTTPVSSSDTVVNVGVSEIISN